MDKGTMPAVRDSAPVTVSTDQVREIIAEMVEDFKGDTRPTLRGLGGPQAERILKIAEIAAKSELIPEKFRGKPNDCFIGLYRGDRLGMDPFGFLEKIFVLDGKVGFEGQLIIAILNRSGRFTGQINFEYSDGPALSFPEKHYMAGKGITDRICHAVAVLAVEKTTVRAKCSLQMAIDSGWTIKHDRAGNLMQTAKQWFMLTDLRLAYRAAAYLGRLYAPDAILGMQTLDELQDISDGSYTDPAKPGKPLFPTVSEAAAATPALSTAAGPETSPAVPASNSAPDTPPLAAVAGAEAETAIDTPPPEPTIDAKRSAFLAIYGTDAEHDMALRFFRSKAWIKPGEVLSDMDDAHVERAYKTADELQRFYGAWKKTVKPEGGTGGTK